MTIFPLLQSPGCLDEAFNTAPDEYVDYADVFSSKAAAELPKHNGINDHAIYLEEGKQPPYRPICSLGPVELETFKNYIKINLEDGLIRPFKSPAGASILFAKKPDGSLWLCVNYRGLTSLTIKNR